jgi:antitoxin component of MazEF toxin-antitoxin module
MTNGAVKHNITYMIQIITKFGNSQGLIFDSALLQLSRLKVGDQVNVEIHSGGTITISPITEMPPPCEVSDLLKDTMRRYATTMKRLA